MDRPDNITTRITSLKNQNSNVSIDLYTINRHLDKLQDQIEVVNRNEQLAKSKIKNISDNLDELIKTQVALKEKADIIKAFLKREEKVISKQREKYTSKKGGICKQVIRDIKDVLKMNERTLALSRDLIEQINN